MTSSPGVELKIMCQLMAPQYQRIQCILIQQGDYCRWHTQHRTAERKRKENAAFTAVVAAPRVCHCIHLPHSHLPFQHQPPPLYCPCLLSLPQPLTSHTSVTLFKWQTWSSATICWTSSQWCWAASAAAGGVGMLPAASQVVSIRHHSILTTWTTTDTTC